MSQNLVAAIRDTSKGSLHLSQGQMLDAIIRHAKSAAVGSGSRHRFLAMM
jgi:hypothetical protein